MNEWINVVKVFFDNLNSIFHESQASFSITVHQNMLQMKAVKVCLFSQHSSSSQETVFPLFITPSIMFSSSCHHFCFSHSSSVRSQVYFYSWCCSHTAFLKPHTTHDELRSSGRLCRQHVRSVPVTLDLCCWPLIWPLSTHIIDFNWCLNRSL